MKRFLTIALISLCVLGVNAEPQDAVGFHTFTRHSEAGFNNNNYGIFARRNSWEVGAYNNSFRKTSVYGGYMLEASNFPLKPAVLVGAVSGYWKPILPYAIFSVSWPISQDWAARVEYASNPWAKGNVSVTHLRFEYHWNN